MSANLRAILIVIVGFAAVLLMIWGVNHTIVQPAFVELEQAQALEDGARAQAAIQSELRQLDQKLGDWAEWDDAYAFAETRDPAFIQSNLGDWGVLERSTQVNLCVIFDRQGRRLYGGGYDSSLGGAVLPAVFAGESPAIWAALQPGLEREQARAGLLLTEHGLLLLAVRPILTTQGSGPARGLLAFGRFLDEPLRRALAEQTQVAFDLLPAGDPRLAPEERYALTTLRAGESELRPGSAGTGFVYTVLPDLTGQPVALVRTPVRQVISATARQTSRALMGALGLGALLLVLGQAVWSNRLRQGGTGAMAAAWSTATVAVLIGLTLTAGLGWDLRRRGLLAPDDFAVQLVGGGITLLLALYLFALVARRQQAETLAVTRTTELQASEERFRRVVNHAPFGFHFYRLAADDRLIFEGANPAADTILKFAHANRVSKPLEEVFPALVPIGVPAAYRRLARDGGIHHCEVVEYRDHQIAGSFEVVAFQTAPATLAVAFTDITDRQRAERQLRRSEEKFAKIFFTTPDVVLISRERDGLLLDVNPGFEVVTGYSRVEAVGRFAVELGLWADLADRDWMVSDLRLHGEVLYRDFTFQRKDGAVRAGRYSARLLTVEDEPTVLFIMQDVTERQQAEANLRQRDHLLRATADAMTLLLSGRDLDQTVGAALATLGQAVVADRAYIFENHTDPATGALLASQRYEWCVDTAIPQLDNPKAQNLSYDTCFPRWYSTLAAGEAIGGPVREFPEAEQAHLEPLGIRSILVLPIPLDDRFWGFIGFDDCYTDRVWTPVEENILRTAAAAIGHACVRLQAEARQRLAAAVFEAARDAIVVTDPNGRIMATNPAFTTLSGYAEAEVQGRSPRLLWADRQPEAYFQDLWETAWREGVWQGEFWVRRRGGERRAALASLGAVRDAEGRITHYVGIATDITALKAAERRIERLAYYDTLTDLPNRGLLAQRAELAMALAARRGTALAVLFLDLDRFKEVNDSLGHAAGDALLVQVADRLQELVRAEDTVCRLGGDEFVLLLPEAGQEGALRVAEKVLAAFRQPFEIAGHHLNATVSIGIALYPHDGADFADLLKNADTALYRAKQDGRNTRVFYDRAMNAATLARMVLEAELRQALMAGQLRAYYQPKVRLADGALVGAEALVRWQHPERGLISPGQFVPMAEASDLIVALGDWMLVEICRQLAAWRRAGRPPLTVAINLAARHFRLPGLADRIGGVLESYGLPAQALELELTESALLEASADTAGTLNQLKRLGVSLALDDFGTGYSSLSYLKRLPLTALKIDQSFVRDLVTDPDDRILSATIVALGHHLELAVVAEGVETEEQRRVLLEQGCDLAQGYLFDQPLPAEDFAAAWLDRSNA